MGGTGKFCVVAMAVGALTGAAASSASAAASYRESDFNFATLGARSISGVVVARQGPGRASGPIRVATSLHRLRANVTYEIVGSTLPCSRQLTGSADRDWFFRVRAARGKTDALRTVRTTTSARLRTIRSVRVYGFVGDIHQPLNLTCSKTEVAIESLD